MDAEMKEEEEGIKRNEWYQCLDKSIWLKSNSNAYIGEEQLYLY